MALAYHVIFGAYGFWLPNDPHGSWSKFIGSWELLRFGKPLHPETAQSQAHIAHDHERRRSAKLFLNHPAVAFDGQQARVIGHGFRRAGLEGQYVFLACAILPEHVHLVIVQHTRRIRRIVGHLKARATQQLYQEGRWPDKDRPVWGEKSWNVFLNDEEDVIRAVEYVQSNPVKEGKRPQRWSFVETRW